VAARPGVVKDYMADLDLKKLLQRAIELAMPNLRHFYRVPRKGQIVKSYASNGQYWADVQPLRNDDSVDTSEPVISRVEIPIMWGGPERGIVCPPTVGTLCDITYYDGDPNYPRISNFRWAKNKAPACELGAFIIQQKPGVYVKITATGNIVATTDADKINDIGGGKSETVGADWSIEVGGSAMIQATVAATVRAPLIHLVGNMTTTGAGGGHGTETKDCDTEQTGAFTLTGDLQVNGSIAASGTIMDGSGNSNHHAH
jgi:hypothetical protein